MKAGKTHHTFFSCAHTEWTPVTTAFFFSPERCTYSRQIPSLPVQSQGIHCSADAFTRIQWSLHRGSGKAGDGQWFCILYLLFLPVDKRPSSSHLEFSRCARTCKTLTNANRLDPSQADDSRLWKPSAFRGSSSPTCSSMLEITLRRDNSFHSQLQKPLKALNEVTHWFRPVHWSERLDDTMGTWKMGMKWQTRVIVESKRTFLASLGA